eukprot:5095775-Alexandrium_andersonii.AAC.1
MCINRFSARPQDPGLQTRAQPENWPVGRHPSLPEWLRRARGSGGARKRRRAPRPAQKNWAAR